MNRLKEAGHVLSTKHPRIFWFFLKISIYVSDNIKLIFLHLKLFQIFFKKLGENHFMLFNSGNESLIVRVGNCR